MKNLYFKRSNDTYLLIKEGVKNIEEGLKEVSEFLERHNYRSYYTRYWAQGGVTIYDVGSWSECFKLAAADKIDQDKIVGTEKNFIDREEENKY